MFPVFPESSVSLKELVWCVGLCGEWVRVLRVSCVVCVFLCVVCQSLCGMWVPMCCVLESVW